MAPVLDSKLKLHGLKNLGQVSVRWKPVAHSHERVEIPAVVASHDPLAHERWKAAQDPWQRSGRTDHSVFGDYASLAASGRFRFPNDGQRARRFPEFHAALLLERKGFICWSGVELFHYGKGLRAGFRKRQTDAVRDLWRKNRQWRWPGDIQSTLAFQPRNPDNVAFHHELGWRFLEVKGLNDHKIDSNQLGALAVLYLLTGAQVAIVHVVPEGCTKVFPRSYEAVIGYRGGAMPSWIHRSH